MRSMIRLTLLLTLALTVGILIFGAMAPTKTSDRHASPYLTALSGAAVRSAEAVPCNNKVCAVDHGPFFKCNPGELGFSSNCELSADARTCTELLPCP